MLNKSVRVDVSGDQKAIMISKLCNNLCLMCHSHTNYSDDYKFHHIDSALDKIDGSEKVIQISGGEPTIRKDFLKILSKIKLKNSDAIIQVNTNGRMFFYNDFTSKCMGFVDVVMTELHGLEDTHDKITQVVGSFRQTCKGITNLFENGINIQIVVLVNRLNFMELPDLANFLKSEYPFVQVSFHYTWFKRNAYENRDILFVKISDIVEYLQKAADILGEKCSFKHFPACIFDENYRGYLVKQTFVIDDREFHPLNDCFLCSIRDECGGIWRNYFDLGGNKSEFRPKYG